MTHLRALRRAALKSASFEVIPLIGNHERHDKRQCSVGTKFVCKRRVHAVGTRAGTHGTGAYLCKRLSLSDYSMAKHIQHICLQLTWARQFGAT